MRITNFLLYKLIVLLSTYFHSEICSFSRQCISPLWSLYTHTQRRIFNLLVLDKFHFILNKNDVGQAPSYFSLHMAGADVVMTLKLHSRDHQQVIFLLFYIMKIKKKCGHGSHSLDRGAVEEKMIL